MIGTITLNAAVDKAIVCEQLRIGGINRAKEAMLIAGGKGINVARTIHRLGGEVIITGFIGGANGRIIKKMLVEEEIKDQFVEIEANSRVCLAILHKNCQTATEIYDPSPFIKKEEWERLKMLIKDLVKKLDIITLNGSLPSGLRDDAYFELITLIKESNPDCKVILDTSGVALKEGIEAKPFMVKPNRDEMESLLGQSLNDQEGQIRAIRTILEKGIELVVLSLGSDGLVCGYHDGIYKLDPIEVKVKSTVGCGDALVGGIAKKLLEGNEIIKAVKYGLACATSNLKSKKTAYVSLEQVEGYYSRVKSKEIFK